MSVSLSPALRHPSGSAFGIPDLEARWQSSSSNYHRQDLTDVLLEPAMPVTREAWVKAVTRLRKGMRVRPLRGLRITMGIKEVLLVIASMAGVHGDRLFAHQRTIATQASYSVRHVRETLAIGVRTGLLVRHTHGAGGRHLPGAYKRQGASYQLTFPGGQVGLEAFMDWLTEWATSKKRERTAHPRRVKVHDARRRAEEFITRNPDMVREISEHLGRPHNRQGALDVVAEIFTRTKTRVRFPRRYVLQALTSEPDLAALYPAVEATGGTTAQVRIAQMLQTLRRPPDF